jgi:TonB family protein
MRSRDASIPFFLWIASAILFHLSGRNSVEQVMTVVEEKRSLRNFAAEVQREVRLETRPVEIALLTQPPVPEPPAPTAEVVPPKQKQIKKKPEVKPEEKPEEKKEQAEKPPEKQAELKPPEKKEPEEKKAETNKKPPQQLILPPKRSIAVRQNVKDKDQPENKEAEFLGDRNNKVDQQTQSRITSTDQNEEKPMPGHKHVSPDKQPGDSDESRVASAQGTEDNGNPLPPDLAKPAPVKPLVNQNPIARNEPPSANGPKAHDAPPPTPKPAEEKPNNPPAPQIAAGDDGEPFFGPVPNTTPAPPKKRLPPPPQKDRYSYGMGLGSGVTTPGGINLNLSFSSAQTVVGKEQLDKDRRADSLRLRSKHRGSWAMAGLNRWKSAIENYVPHVKPGNQTALNTRAVPFANYLNSMHQRIHVIFADSFLPSLDQFPKNHQLNNFEMHTELEIILNQTEGGVVTLGIVKTSGVTAFDINALEAVNKAAPFGKPPNEIVSPDGNVYLHWEFHRNPDMACSTWFAYPYILKGPPAPAATPPQNSPPSRNLERSPLGALVPTSFEVPQRRSSSATHRSGRID